MAKSKVKVKSAGFYIEGILDYENKVISVEELGDYPISAVLRQFDGKSVKITIDEIDREINEIPEVENVEEPEE